MIFKWMEELDTEGMTEEEIKELIELLLEDYRN